MILIDFTQIVIGGLMATTHKTGEEIDDKLDALLHIRTNSSRKGRLSEDLCIRRLSQQYPDWDFSDVTYVGHEGDCRAISSPIGDILYEFKSYDTNVNKEQLKKFYKDLETTGIKLGIFVSNTSGIVGKKDLEWEIIKGDIRSKKDTEKIFRDINIVYHLACISNDPSFELNPKLSKSINYDSPR